MQSHRCSRGCHRTRTPFLEAFHDMPSSFPPEPVSFLSGSSRPTTLHTVGPWKPRGSLTWGQGPAAGHLLGSAARKAAARAAFFSLARLPPAHPGGGAEGPELGCGRRSSRTAGAGSEGRVGCGSDPCSTAAVGSLGEKRVGTPPAGCLCEPSPAGFLFFLFKIRPRRKSSPILSFPGEGKGNVKFCTCSSG